jgi:hypothetical protein
VIKDAIANIAKWPRLKPFKRCRMRLKFESIIHCILKLPFASDVPLRGLHRSVTGEKLNLFQFPSTTMAQLVERTLKLAQQGCTPLA